MSAYRDELEAAQQRIEQLERELGDAQKELARLRKTAKRGKPKKPRKPRKRRKWLKGDSKFKEILLPAGLGLGGAAAMYVLCVHILAEDSAGTLSSRGGELGDWSFAITHCHSGQDYSPSFDGVELSGQDPDAVLRVARQNGELWIMARPPRSSETAPGVRAGLVQIDPEHCEIRDVVMDRSSFSGTSREGGSTIWNVDGHIRLDCSTQGGGRLIATAEFERCTF